MVRWKTGKGWYDLIRPLGFGRESSQKWSCIIEVNVFCLNLSYSLWILCPSNWIFSPCAHPGGQRISKPCARSCQDWIDMIDSWERWQMTADSGGSMFVSIKKRLLTTWEKMMKHIPFGLWNRVYNCPPPFHCRLLRVSGAPVPVVRVARQWAAPYARWSHGRSYRKKPTRNNWSWCNLYSQKPMICLVGKTDLLVDFW